MSDERAQPVINPAYIGRALQRLTDDMAVLRDEMRVQTAMIARHDAALAKFGAAVVAQEATSNAMLEQLRAMVAQHQRTADRVRRLEEERS